jgi:hypothetical protein
MAIYHLNLKTIGRSEGRSATASAAYRAGEAIFDRRSGLLFDYTKKMGVDGAEILAPSDSPCWGFSRAELWNRVEEAEKRKDSQLCREIEFALPVELTPEQNMCLARDFIRAEFVSLGMVADLAFHKLTSHNPHAHVLLTMRKLTADGFGPKVRDWNEHSLCDYWRERWANYANMALAAAGKIERIDHRNLTEQALDRIEAGNFSDAKALDRFPTIHEGRNPLAANYNQALSAVNSERLAVWDSIERQAMAEARLMTPYYETRPEAVDASRISDVPQARRLTSIEADYAFRSEIATAKGVKAANWRAADLRLSKAIDWLGIHKDDESKHRKQIEASENELIAARLARKHFEAVCPEPWGWWIFNRRALLDWQNQKHRIARRVLKAKKAIKQAEFEYTEFTKRRKHYEMEKMKALKKRRGLELLPSEKRQEAGRRADLNYEYQHQASQANKVKPTNVEAVLLPIVPQPKMIKPKLPGPR